MGVSPSLEDKDFDIGVFSLGQLKAYAEWGSGEEWGGISCES